MHAVEKEIIKATGYSSRKKYTDRQDYLGSVLNAVLKLTDDDFDNLSDEAAEWSNAAVAARNTKNQDIPDFDEVQPSDDEAEDDVEGDEEAEAETAEEVSDPEDPEDETEDAETEDEPDPEDEDEDEPEEAPVKAKKKAVEKPVKAAPKKPVKKASLDDDADVVLDKWGCMEGSKNARALDMFEKGATTKEVKEEIGGTYYNILKKMEQAGHKLEKEGAIIKLTHKSAKLPPKKKK